MKITNTTVFCRQTSACGEGSSIMGVSNMPKENTKRKNNAKIPKYKNTHDGNISFCLQLRKQLQEPAVETDAKSKKFFSPILVKVTENATKRWGKFFNC